MRKITVTENSILFSRKGELVRLTACGENAIRFQGFPGCKLMDGDYNFMPQSVDAVIEDDETRATITCNLATVQCCILLSRNMTGRKNTISKNLYM